MKDEDIAKELAAINEQLKTIFLKLDDIGKTLHGNGRPGLVERVTMLEVSGNTKDNLLGKLIEWGALVITAITAAYAAFFKGGNP